MINCSDCSDNRLFTLSVSPVTGLTADQPAAAPTADMAIRTAIKPTKIRTGSGRALPSRSTPSRKRLRSCIGYTRELTRTLRICSASGRAS